MKEAAGVRGGRGQVTEKVRECGLKLLREEKAAFPVLSAINADQYIPPDYAT